MAPEEARSPGTSSRRSSRGASADSEGPRPSRTPEIREGGSGARSDDAPAAAESELIDRFWQRVRLLAVRKLGDPTAAEDVAQETLRRVIEAVRQDRIRNPDALPAFVLQTARHVCSHRLRDSHRRSKKYHLFRREPEENPSPRDPVASLVSRERREAVREALARLSDSDRTLLRRFFYEGHETREVASDLDLEAGTVRVRKHRALRRLARELGEKPG